jgi:hypothetical protein
MQSHFAATERLHLDAKPLQQGAKRANITQIRDIANITWAITKQGRSHQWQGSVFRPADLDPTV